MALSVVQGADLFKRRRDMRYVHDDPVLWPQLFSDAFCHLAAIPKAPTSAHGRAELGVMRWNSTPKDFAQRSPFLAITPSRPCAHQRVWALSAIHSYPHPSRILRQIPPISTTASAASPTIPALPTFSGRHVYRAGSSCPLQAFANENILYVVVPFAATDFLEMRPTKGFSPVPTTDRLEDRLRTLHKCTQNTLCNRRSRVPVGARPERVLIHTQQHERSQRRKSRRTGRIPTPRLLATSFCLSIAQKCHENPCWAAALAAVDRSCPPFCGVDLPQRYVFPEPALLASPEDKVRWLMRDALMFRLADPDGLRHCCLRKSGEMCFKAKSMHKARRVPKRKHARSATLEGLLRPAFEACDIDALTEFPVPPNAVPRIHLRRMKEFWWELAEMNFRYEFLALDARASGLDRPDQCRKDGLIGPDFRESQRGLATPAVIDRPSAQRFSCATGRFPASRSRKSTPRSSVRTGDIRLLERQVATFYTQSFYEVFGRAAVNLCVWSMKSGLENDMSTKKIESQRKKKKL
ncbi:hypothetical protein C8R45DRAFT_922173 [Mycena sanguinolenta]|nr:hypothetical protein C8R45DRAFT_922173 [Mycena sanguinolenta]